jgi:4-diphosphocytidyl-2-C-methyl-D-erythritol kinase
MASISRTAPAKLNLSLEVVGRREDGWHLLDSLVAFTEYGDRLQADEAEALTLALDGPFGALLAVDPSENLVLRAARALAAEAGIAPRAALKLTKNLPIASGIGGGSSDAAAALTALAELWHLAVGPDDLARIGLGLGADLPVCLAGRSSRLQGIGERITPVPALPPAPIVLVNPGIGLATPQVFRARHGPFSTGAGAEGLLQHPSPDAAALAAALAASRNDLTEASISLLPVVAEMLAVLAAASGALLARMSGSGATCFALFPEDGAACAAAAAIERAHPAWWVVATRLAGT